MATLESQIFSVTISLDTTPVSRAGFSRILIMGPNSGLTQRYKVYGSAAEILADASAGIVATDAEYKQAVAAFNNGAVDVAIGRVDAGDATWAAALTAILAESTDFYCIVPTSTTQADLESLASGLAAAKKVAFIGSSDTSGIGGGGSSDLASELKADSIDRAAVFLHDTAADALILPAAAAAKFFSFNPDVTAPIVAHQTYTGVTIDTDLTTSEMTNALSKNANVYSSSKGVGAAWPGTMASGLFIDQMLLRDWYEARITEDLQELASTQANAGSRIPYTTSGFAMVENVFRKRDSKGIAAGWFDEFDDDGERAFRFTAPAAGSSKATRTLSVTARHRQTGAVQEFIVSANLENT